MGIQQVPIATDNVVIDVLVIGAGAAGLSAAISARLEKLDVLIVEKTSTFGGTAARSGGMLWVPMNPLAVRDGVKDSADEARQYVSAVARNSFRADVVDAYLEAAPLMVETYAKHLPAMRFVRTDAVADNYANLPGAKDKGRTLTVEPFDARELGADAKFLAPPLATMTFLGMMVSARELIHFFDVWRSKGAFKLVARRLLNHAKDVATHGRAMHLANGSALVGRLAKAAFGLDVPVWLSSPVVELLNEGGRVAGAVVRNDGRNISITARRGVVLATGGYAHDAARRQLLAPIKRLAEQMYPMAKEGIDGDGIRLAESVGGRVESSLFNTVSWWPVSKVPRRGGGFDLYAHGFDRSKPGFIIVNRAGQRFISETAIGNDLVRAMADAAGDGPVEAFLIADHSAVRRFGIGIVRPAPLPLAQHVASGYLTRGKTLRLLATAAGIDADGLEATVQAFNAQAALGEDPQFGRGTSGLDKRNGDPTNMPNPSLRALEHGPFYAVKLLPGDFSTLAGLVTDGHARVLDANGAPIAGLYAAGNDLSTMGGGTSPAGGFTLGPAVTFGFVAGRHLATLPGLPGRA